MGLRRLNFEFHNKNIYFILCLRRIVRVNALEVCRTLPMIVASLLTGYFIKYAGYLPPFIAIFVGMCLCTIYAIFCVPETIAESEKAGFFTTSHLNKAARFYFVNDGHTYRMLLLMSLAGALILQYSQPVEILFLMNHPLCWDSVLLTIFFTAERSSNCIAGMAFSYFTHHFLSTNNIVILAMLASMFRQIGKALVRTTAEYFMCKFHFKFCVCAYVTICVYRDS